MSATAKEVEVKEKPIIFSGPMVRAILEGRKTQTRRVITPQPTEYSGVGHRFNTFLKWKTLDTREAGFRLNAPRYAPHGKTGDRLWVRETWRTEERGSEMIDGIGFRADSGFRRIEDTQQAAENWVVANHDGNGNKMHKVWRPSIFMPRWASRISLEITNVRVERVQEINEEDAKAEGLDPRLCVDIFNQVTGKVRESHCYWLEHEETGEEDSGENGNYCRACALKRQKRRGKKWLLCGDGGSAMESDGPAYCECGTPLLMSLTEYGVERELRIEDDPHGKEPQYFPVAGMDAQIVATLADDIGDLQPKHHGRLAQIGFATAWGLLNAKRGYSWESNPWVWVIEFRKL